MPDAAPAAPSVPAPVAGCPLCAGPGGEVLWADDFLRVILADEPDHPAFVRVVLQAHVAEMTDLPPAARERLMAAVWRAEAALRGALAPDKVNLAAFGNMVPHLHWHVIGRWRDDRHFPGAVWAAPGANDGPVAERRRQAVRATLPALRSAIVHAFDGSTGGG
jgi:diadenosine tetraphosphate (Ap4A) HIT family hydrolase